MMLGETKIHIIIPTAMPDMERGKDGNTDDGLMTGGERPGGQQRPNTGGLPSPVIITGEDVVTISKEVKTAVNLISSDITGNTVDVPIQKGPDVKTLIEPAIKERLVKAEKYMGQIGVSEELEPITAERVDIVSITKEMKSAIRTMLITDTGQPRELNLPQGLGLSPYVVTLLSELLPEWKIRLLKVYRRKSAGKARKKDGKKDGKKGTVGDDAPNVEYEEELFSSHFGEHSHDPKQTRLMSDGYINAAGYGRYNFSLRLDISSETAMALRGKGVKLDSLIINYDGPPEELEDLSFTFESVDAEGAPFKGTASGHIIIDLVRLSTNESGGSVYGLKP